MCVVEIVYHYNLLEGRHYMTHILDISVSVRHSKIFLYI